ncbi:MAG: polyphosphate--glucose phosphotransferase [Chloroflexota bacterium]
MTDERDGNDAASGQDAVDEGEDDLRVEGETPAEPPTGPVAIGVDIGGSGIKGAAVEVTTGRLVSERIRVPTPQPSIPDAVIESTARVVERLARSAHVGADTPVGVGFPAVVIDGIARTAANVDKGWVDFPADDRMEARLHRSVSLVNDADAAGLAEMRFGAGAGHKGVVIVLTLGTGVGSGVFVDGVLVPNTELGHMEIRGRDAERRSAAAARVRRGLSWKAWATDLDEHLQAIDRIFWPQLFILGGGVSKRADKFIDRLTVRPPVIPAKLLNEAGIVGAAMVVAERSGLSTTGPAIVTRTGEPSAVAASA